MSPRPLTNGQEIQKQGERLASLEERVFENHTNTIKDIESKLSAIDNKVWKILILLAGNFGTGILALLK